MQTPNATTAMSGPRLSGGRIPHEDETQAVDGEGSRGDGHDPGGEPVEAVDEVHGVGDDDDPQRRQQRRHVGGEHEEADERDLELEHRHAEEDEHHRREHLPGHLGRRRHLSDVVDEPHDEDDGRPEHEAERLRRPREQPVQLAQLRCHQDGDGESQEHGDAAPVGGHTGVDPTLVGLDHETGPGGQTADREHHRERAEGGHDGHDRRMPREGARPQRPPAGLRQRGAADELGIGREPAAQLEDLAPHVAQGGLVPAPRAGRGRSAPRPGPSPSVPIPAVVWAAVPSRSPEVTNGERGSSGNGVAVEGDPGPIEDLLGLLCP